MIQGSETQVLRNEATHPHQFIAQAELSDDEFSPVVMPTPQSCTPQCNGTSFVRYKFLFQSYLRANL